jgi:hypothetical protein
MTATVEQARDQIINRFLETWEADALTTGIRTADDAILFWNKPGDPPTTPDANNNPPTWLRVAVRHYDGGQSALVDATGRKLVTRRGMVTISLFEASKTGGALSDKLARIAESAFEGQTTSGGVWFKRVRTLEFGPDGVYFRTDVWADFEYDDVLNS